METNIISCLNNSTSNNIYKINTIYGLQIISLYMYS